MVRGYWDFILYVFLRDAALMTTSRTRGLHISFRDLTGVLQLILLHLHIAPAGAIGRNCGNEPRDSLKGFP